MGQKGLGRLYDIAPVFSPVNMATAANSGLLVSLENAHGVDFVLYKAAGTAGDDPVITVREAQDSSGTGEQDLDVVTSYYAKTDTTNNVLSGNETWSEQTQTAGDIALDAAGGNAEDESIIVFYVDADDLSDGFTHVTFDVADTGTNAQIGAAFALVHRKDLRDPANLSAPQ